VENRRPVYFVFELGHLDIELFRFNAQTSLRKNMTHTDLSLLFNTTTTTTNNNNNTNESTCKKQ
jgi:hypothetical protein